MKVTEYFLKDCQIFFAVVKKNLKLSDVIFKEPSAGNISLPVGR
jgi:hypothetical protein